MNFQYTAAIKATYVHVMKRKLQQRSTSVESSPALWIKGVHSNSCHAILLELSLIHIQVDEGVDTITVLPGATVLALQDTEQKPLTSHLHC